jgi:tRNA(Arg) A34 adenosine deaminase TadA
VVSTTDVLVGARIHREEEEEEVEGIAEQQRKHELGEQIRHAEIETIARALDHTNTRLKLL